MMETKDYLIAGILILMIIAGGIGFLINFSESQGGQVSIMDDPSMKALNNSVINELSKGEIVGNSQKDAIYGENPTQATDGFLFSSMISAPKKYFDLFIASIGIVLTLIKNNLGLAILLISGFITIVTIVVVFAIWRTTKQG